MKTLKKMLITLLCLSLTLVMVAGCSGDKNASETSESISTEDTSESISVGGTESVEDSESDSDAESASESSGENGSDVVQNYVISFEDAEGNAVAEPIEFSEETINTIEFPEISENLQKEGYTVAWDKTVEDVTLANLKVTLVYTAIEYTIQFVDLEGVAIVGGEPITYTVETMAAVEFPEIPVDYQKAGYTVAWDKTPADVTLGGCTVTIKQPVANVYQIVYDSNGGSQVEGQNVTFDTAYTVADAPTREYYTFDGWYIVSEGEMTETKLESGDAWQIASDVTVRAKWTIIDGEYAMKYNFNVVDNPVSQITKQAYAGGSEVSFKYYIPEGTVAGWWGIAWHTDATKANNYHAAGAENPLGYKELDVTTGAWVNVKFTLPESGEYYLYFGAEVDPNNKWLLNDGSSYALIDNFTVGEVKEDFDGGLDDSIFAVNNATAVTLGEGYYFERGEYAMKYNFNVVDNPVTQITKQAYAGGSEVSFKYYIPEGTVAGWWGIAWHTDATKANNYHAAGIENAIGYQELGGSTGVWLDVKFTLPAEGEYYLYFGAEVNPNNKWVLNGGNSYALIDDFKVGEVTEDFNGGLEDSIFAVNNQNAVELGEGYVAPVFEEGAYAMKYVFNASGETVSQVTKKAYPAGTKVSFKYFIPEGVTAQWWGICWSTKNTGLDIYAAATSSSAKPLDKVIGEWKTVEFTLPTEGGDYYLYFGSEVGNWKFADGTNAYVLIDDFKVGDEVENFNKPFEENAMFNVLVPGTVMLSAKDEGAPDAINGNTMLTFSATAIGGYERVAMITGSAYSQVTEITFDAVWTGKATSARWGLSYTTDPTQFSYGSEVSAINCYTPKLGELKMDVGVQYTYKLTFAEGKYYLYAKSVEESDFTEITNGDYTEGANYFYIMVCPAVGGEGSIFYMDNFSITTASGTVIDKFDDETSTLFIESATNTSHYGSSGMGFIRSEFEEA